MRNACTTGPRKSPYKPGRASANAICPSSFGYVFSRKAPIAFRSAIACEVVTPGFRCPMTMKIQWVPRLFKSVLPSSCSSLTSGTNTSGLKNINVPWNPGGATPTIVRMLVQSNDAADDRRIVLKMRMPVAVTQHDVGHAVGAMLVGGMEKPAQVRLNPQCVEIVPGDRLGPGARRIVAGVEADLREAERGEIVEGAVAIAEVDVIGIDCEPALSGPRSIW